MDAKSVEKQIKDKLTVIGDSIASFFGINSDVVNKKLSELDFYVYDDYKAQSGRLINQELYKIANEYAIDVFDDLIIPDKEKELLVKKLATIIVRSYYLDNEALEPMIDSLIDESVLKEFKSIAKRNFKITIENFLKDYETKSIIALINTGDYYYKEAEKKSYLVKSKILKEMFNINVDNYFTIDLVWDSFSAFGMSEEELNNASDEYREEKIRDMLKPYSFMGIEATTLKEAQELAKKLNIVINRDTIVNMENAYITRFTKDASYSIGMYTNIDSIQEDLRNKGYSVDNSNIAYMFSNPGVYGVNFEVRNKFRRTSYILFCNNEALYTSEFNDTCIHEFIHYLGGMNSFCDKRGLLYGEGKNIYLHLEEAYVNATSKAIKEIVVDKVGNIVEPSEKKEAVNFYDKTLGYMNFVLKHYLKPLSEIHFGTNITLADANKKMPYDVVAKSVTRLMDCDKNNVEKYTKEEIEKLKKYLKKR